MKHNLETIQNLSNIKHNYNFIILSGQTYVNNKSELKFYCKTCNNIIVKQHDKIKTDYCVENNIKLIRINFNDNIYKKLKIFL